MPPLPRRRPHRRHRAGLGCLAALTVTLGGCTAAVSVPPGEYAADPVCGEILQWLPQSIGGAERRSITSQATAAWGDPAITVRCGIDPPAPTTDRCITVTAGELDVDWIVLEDEELPGYARQDQGSWVFRSYGRLPAVEVVVPAGQAGDHPTGVLVALAPALDIAEVQRECVGVTDVY